MIRNEFFRRVITRCAASSLACAASERKLRSRGSFSKYSSRQGAQSVSNSFFGNSSMRISQSVLLQGKLPASHSSKVNLSIAKCRQNKLDCSKDFGGIIMRRIFFIVLATHLSLLTGQLLAGEKPAAEDELTRIKREYADVL